MAPGNQSQSPALSGAGRTKEGEQGSIDTPLYVISPQELKLLGWLKEAKKGDRIELSSLLPPPPTPGAIRVDERTKFFNFRVRYDAKKKTLVLKSGGFTITANALKGIRIYKDEKILKEYDDCWASRLWSIANTLSEKYGFNIFNEKWQSISLPDDKDVKKFVALVASLINNRVADLKDPFFRACLNNSSNSKTP